MAKLLVIVFIFCVMGSSSVLAVESPIRLDGGWNHFGVSVQVENINLLTNNCRNSYRRNNYWENNFSGGGEYFKCFKPVNKKVVDSRVGITHIAGMYPDRFPQGDFLKYGIEDALSLGFRTIEISISPEACTRTDLRPNGMYQSLGYCGDCVGSYNCQKGIVDIAKSDYYRQAFVLPYKTLIVTTEAFKGVSTSAWNIAVRPVGVERIESSKLSSLKQEFSDFTKFLFDTYGDFDKTIIIQTPNELDWHLIANKWQAGVDMSNTEPDGFAILNAIDYLNYIQDGINEVRNENLGKKLKIYHSCEINKVLKAKEGQRAAVNSVVPYTRCDLYGYSAYEAYITFSAGSERLIEAINYIKEKAPDSPTIFGANNVFVSEFGVPHGSGEPYIEERAAVVYGDMLEKMLNLSTPYFMYWQLYDNECRKANPINSDCRGFWLKKPDGTLSKVYDVLSKYTLYSD